MMSQRLYRLGVPTWYRYLFFRFSLLVVMLLGLCFFLFVFADLIAHIKDVVDPKTRLKIWCAYYLCMFSCRLDVLLPFSLATATSLFLPRLIRNNELIPLLNAGISLKTLMKPFFVIAILASVVLSANYQYFYPQAIHRHHRIVDSDFGRESLPSTSDHLGIVLFKGGSRLFFGSHDQKKKRVDDVFWVRSPDYVCHIEKLLYFRDRLPEGHGVDVMKRTPDGRMKKTASYPFSELPELEISRKAVKMAMADPKELSIFQLGSLFLRFGSSNSERAIETTVSLYQRLLFPLLAWLAFLFPAPFCLRFENRYSQALLVFFSLATLFCFLLVIQATPILVRAPLLLPTCLLFLPWCVALFVGIRRMHSLQ